MKIALFDAKPHDERYFEQANTAHKYGFDITYFSPQLQSQNAVLTKGFVAICIFVNDVLDAQLINMLRANGVRIIALRCAGYNNVDLRALGDDLKLVRVPSYSPNAVAEHTVALMLSTNRKVHRAHLRVRDSNFSLNGLIGFDMCGKTAGIIGSGKIGKIVCKILRGFDMRVIVYDQNEDHAWAQSLGVTYCALEQIYAESDIISLHCPLTADNVHLINEQSIARMRPHVMIVNTSRGALIDTHALIVALKHRQIGFAALDVYEEERAYFFEDHSDDIIDDEVLQRLITFPNALITSHQAFFTHEAVTNIAETTLDTIFSYLQHGELKNEVTRRAH